MKTLHLVMSIMVLVCLVASGAGAQDTTGAIAGRVADAQGLALPAVTVTATGVQGSNHN